MPVGGSPSIHLSCGFPQSVRDRHRRCRLCVRACSGEANLESGQAIKVERRSVGPIVVVSQGHGRQSNDEGFQCGADLGEGESFTAAHVGTAAEREMLVVVRTVDVHRERIVEHRGIQIGGTERDEHDRTGW